MELIFATGGTGEFLSLTPAEINKVVFRQDAWRRKARLSGVALNAVLMSQSIRKHSPRIRLHPRDNVGIAVNNFGLPAGIVFADGTAGNRQMEPVQ